MILNSLTNLICMGKVIPPGQTFEVPDSLGTSLVERGFAKHLKEARTAENLELDLPENVPPVENVPEVEDEKSIRKEYGAMSTDDLKKLAEENSVDIEGLKKKAQIIDALVKFELGE